MSNVTPFPKPGTTADAAFSTPQAEGVAESIKTLFDKLPLSDRQVLVELLTKDARLIPASRAGEVLGAVARFLPEKAEWTAQEIRDRLATDGVTQDGRAAFNAIGYLARKGRIERLGGGRYRIGGMAVVTTDDLGGEPPRYDYED